MIDTTIHLGDIITTFIATILTLVGWGLRKMYRSVYKFVRSIEGLDERIEESAEIIDIHTDVLAHRGFIKRNEVAAVSKRRRKSDRGLVRKTDID